MKRLNYIILMSAFLFMVNAFVFADVIVQCDILKQHEHVIDKNKNLISCSYGLQHSFHGRQTFYNAYGMEHFTDTICKWQSIYNYYPLCNPQQRYADTLYHYQDNGLGKLGNARRKFVAQVIEIDEGNSLWSLYTSSTYLIPLFLTLLIETLLAIGFMLLFNISLRFLWVVPLCSLITHPILAYLQWNYFLPFNQIVETECAIVIVEMLIIMAALQNRIKPRYAFALSLLMNGGSFVLGMAIV